jgi:hypothetical protein
MSALKVIGGATGTGTVSLTGPVTNTNRTLTLPDVTGTVVAEQFGDTVFKQSNILGTVSESGGVPTGAIIESGSNADGEYVKYADGTMICMGETGTTTQVADSGAGTYRYRYDQKSSNFPATFAFVPWVLPSFVNMGLYNTASVEGSFPTTTTNTGRIRGASITTSSTTGYYQWVAIGRWF